MRKVFTHRLHDVIHRPRIRIFHRLRPYYIRAALSWRMEEVGKQPPAVGKRVGGKMVPDVLAGVAVAALGIKALVNPICPNERFHGQG